MHMVARVGDKTPQVLYTSIWYFYAAHEGRI